MPIMEISVVPLGTKTPSVSRHVASCVGILRRKKGISYVLTAMGTIVEAKRCSTLVRLAEQMHSSVFEHGVQRVVTTIKIDDRRDKPLTIEGKLDSVRQKMQNNPKRTPGA